MKKTLVNKSEIKLVGLKTRTNNSNEMNPEVAKIGALVGQFHRENIASQLSHRTHPGVILSVYTEYDSNEHGDYTYFIGEEVDSFDNVPSGLHKLTIPASKYQKFTTPVGKMPNVLIEAWMQLWKMSASDFGGERAYVADFEIYDERASDPAKTSLDIYIGIK